MVHGLSVSRAGLNLYGATGPKSGSSGGIGSGPGGGSGESGSGIGTGGGLGCTARNADRAGSRTGSFSSTSHSQQSLQRKHRSQRWFRQVSLVQRAHIRVDSSSQMAQANGITDYFFFPVVLFGGGSVATIERHRCASRSITAHSCSRSEASETI